jgi:hypothetical protein
MYLDQHCDHNVSETRHAGFVSRSTLHDHDAMEDRATHSDNTPTPAPSKTLSLNTVLTASDMQRLLRILSVT